MGINVDYFLLFVYYSFCIFIYLILPKKHHKLVSEFDEILWCKRHTYDSFANPYQKYNRKIILHRYVNRYFL